MTTPTQAIPSTSSRSILPIVLLGLSALTLSSQASTSLDFRERAGEILENDRIRVAFNEQGMVSLHDKKIDQTLNFANDNWSFVIEGNRVDSVNLKSPSRSKADNVVRYSFRADQFSVDVVYELKPGWRFVSKQLFITDSKNEEYKVDHVDVCHGQLTDKPQEVYVADMGKKYKSARELGDYGAFVRVADNWGGMFVMQNPFMKWKFVQGGFSMDYNPDMDWDQKHGPFESDRACIGIYDRLGVLSPGEVHHRVSWLLEPTWTKIEKKIDMGEVEALIECVRAFLLYKPTKSEVIHIPWCENDYQIDVATDEGEAQYKRIVDMASALNVGHMLYTVRNTDIAVMADAADNWHWEHLLWLNQGIDIRKNKWDPKKDELPAKTKELMRYAEKKGVKLMAYMYPSLPFEQNPEWLTKRWKHKEQVAANLGIRSFQDWMIENLLAFKERTGISGYAFDYWSMSSLGASRYAQWYGTRRILEGLRKGAPDIVIDGRQTYHGYGPWTWLAGNYPHPTGGDEQPESFETFPDLHFDRSSGTQQRVTTYWFRNMQFCPTEIMPGFITHQTARKDADGHVDRQNDTILRDWDYLGWKFSLISSVATAPFAHCVDMIPARDTVEHGLFMKDTASQEFMTGWFDWTDRNMDVLRNLRSIIGPPAMGRADGTAAINGDRGFIFLFNPNHRKIRAEFRLDRSIGLTAGTRFAIKHLYPEEGKCIGAPGKALYEYGDTCSFMMDGTTAWVLEVQPVTEIAEPMLFNVRGKVQLNGDQLKITEALGEVGSNGQIQVLVPGEEKITQLAINGRETEFTQEQDVVTAKLHFDGDYFAHNQAVTTYDPTFNGSVVKGEFVVPERIFEQLKERRRKWPIEWTEEDLECTWLAPERLLLYVQLAEPDWTMETSMKLDGNPVDVKKAYSSRSPGMLRRGKGHNTFTGFYVDVSQLEPGRKYDMEVTLPSGLKPGQFQGVFFENVETEYTTDLK